MLVLARRCPLRRAFLPSVAVLPRMPPKFAKKLGASAGAKDVDLCEPAAGATPAPKGRRKRPSAASPPPRGRETPPKQAAGAQAGADEAAQDGEQPAKKPRARKPKPEGPYTCFREQGSIPEPSLPRRPADRGIPAGRERFGVLAWNVGGLRAFLANRVGDLQEAVRQSAPDVFGIMEHKLQAEGSDTAAALDSLLGAFPDYELGAVSYSTAKKGYSGTLVLIRKECEKPLKVTPEDLPSAADEGRLVVAEFEKLFVVLCYVPNSGEGLKRLSVRIEEWDVQLRDRLRAMAERKPVVLVGDMNVAHQDRDIWNVEAPHIPKSAGTTPQERESFTKLLGSGFRDGFSLLHPEALGAFTYWSVRAGNRKTNRGLRLDYVLVSDGVALEGRDEEAAEPGAGPGRPVLLDTFHLAGLATGDHCPIGAVLAV